MKNKSKKNSDYKDLVLIVDGPDGVGKSTVCKILSKRLALPIVKMPHMKKYFDSKPEEMSHFFNEIIVQMPRGYILDRCYPSSLVYSRVYNRKYDLSYVATISSQLKPVTVILTATDEVLLNRKKDELILPEEIIKINKTYKLLAQSIGWVVIDTTNISPEAVADLICDLL